VDVAIATNCISITYNYLYYFGLLLSRGYEYVKKSIEIFEGKGGRLEARG